MQTPRPIRPMLPHLALSSRRLDVSRKRGKRLQCIAANDEVAYTACVDEGDQIKDDADVRYYASYVANNIGRRQSYQKRTHRYGNHNGEHEARAGIDGIVQSFFL